MGKSRLTGAAINGGTLMRHVCFCLFTCLASAAAGHPHVFVDGRIDFVFHERSQLNAIEVTWLYDPFETLYVLSSLEIDLPADGMLSDAQQAKLIEFESNWAEDFDGAARLAHSSSSIELEAPRNFSVQLVDNRLQVRFERALRQPLLANAKKVEVTFYEESYFFAFTIAQAPHLLGQSEGCTAQVEPFDPETDLAALQGTLAKLGREETPEDSNVGALFTDRIFLSCA